MPTRVLSTRLVQVGVKAEAVEGTPETIAAANLISIYNPSFNPNIAKFTRTPVSSTFGSLPGLAGIQLGVIAFEVELKSSGDVAKRPEWETALLACGFQALDIESFAGAISGGPFLQGELCNDGGTWKGYAAKDIQDADAKAFFVTLSGGPLTGSETITGEASGATCVLSAAGTVKGVSYRPKSDNPISATVARFMDGTRAEIAGARGNVQIVGNQVGEPLFLNFSFEGAYQPFIDTPMLTGEDYDKQIPGVFMGANFSIMDLLACIASINIDAGNVLSQRICANAPGGILATWISNREASGNADPEMTLVADHDFYGRLVDGATGSVKFEVKETSGTKIYIACPRVEYMNIGESDRDSVAVAGVDFGCRKASISEGDDEIIISIIYA